ncbi:MAG: phosphogluconate dehydrogenase (NAD(+)-dependent, decarboxylating) [Bacteroidota bacterium]
MNIGIIGLGKMGSGLVRRLHRGGHTPIGFDLDTEELAKLAYDDIGTAESLDELAGQLEAPRVFWLMVPAGEAVDSVLADLEPHLEAGSIVVDGGNSYYQDSMRRAKEMKEDVGALYVDCGVSGGVWGLEGGYCLMVGGEDEPVGHLRPVFETLAPAKDKGWGHMGPSGSGHFVKMIHNGIEYGLMQAYAEGFALMTAKEEFDLDTVEISNVWQYGSVIRSWLLELVENALQEDGPGLSDIAPYVADSGMGRWTVKEAMDLNIPAPVLTHSLIERIQSRDDRAFYSRLLAALRNQFGGHALKAAVSGADSETGT